MKQSVSVSKVEYGGCLLIMRRQEAPRAPPTRRRRRAQKPQTRLSPSEGSLRRLRVIRKEVLTLRLMVADERTRFHLRRRRSWLFTGEKGLPTLARLSARYVHGRHRLFC